jgi:hypothetical protein
MKRTILTTAALAAVILMASGASADVTSKYFYYAAGSASWDTSAYWFTEPDGAGTPNSPPSSSERAVIQTACSLDTSKEVESIDVRNTLSIQDDRVLTLNNGSSSDSTISGTVYLVDSDSELAITTNNHTISGSGSLVGQDDDALITVASSRTLTNQTTIAGAMKIQGGASAIFDNDGLVVADDPTSGSNTITCDTGTFRGDYTGTDQGVYKVDGGTLKFSTGVDDTGMDARFIITDSGGLLDIDENISTTDEFEQYGGTINVQGYVEEGEIPAKTFSAS